MCLLVNNRNYVCTYVFYTTPDLASGSAMFENRLLCFLELLQYCAYHARFYATPQSIMLLIIHN